MTTPDPGDVSPTPGRRRVELAKDPRHPPPAAGTGPRRTAAWTPDGAAATPARRRPGRRALLAGLVTLLLAAGVVTAVVVGAGGGTAPAPPSAAASRSATPSTTPTLAATDRLVQDLQVGQCVAMTDRLDGATDPDAAGVACDAATATFTVTSANERIKARAPCPNTADTFLRSLVVHRVVCLGRFVQRGQCILGNDAQQNLGTVVACDSAPSAPFTRVYRIVTLDQSGAPVTCTAPLVLLTATPNRSMCLSRVR